MSFIRTHLRLPFRFEPGRQMNAFADGLRAGEIFGSRCDSCRTTYVPPRAFCSQCWELCDGWERVADSGTVITYVIVNVPFHGQQVDIPYVLANVLLDGAGVPVLHLLGTLRKDGSLAAPIAVSAGQRVRAVWRSPELRTGSLNDDIECFQSI